MEITIKKTVTSKVKYLRCKCGVRYWEDSRINGKEDIEGDLIPFRDNDYWCPVIDIDEGKIIDWPKGTVANIHYKVCDDGFYALLNEHEAIIREIDGYVPSILSPKEPGFGDYVILDIDEKGFIDGWKCDLKSFLYEDEK